MKIHLIDVGQGAATLFEFTCGAVLVDTGGETNGAFNSGDALRAYLDQFFDERPDLVGEDHKGRIDLLVVSHPHIDHARNVRMVTEEYDVRHVVTDGLTEGSGGRQQKWLQDWARPLNRLETIETEAILRGGKTSPIIDPLNCGDVDPKLAVLWGAVTQRPDGWTEANKKNANNNSVVLRVDFGKASVLVTGDLEVEGIDELVKRQRPALNADVWEVSHHGSHNGVTKDWLDVVTPSIALLATGPEERHTTWTAWQYGHPRKDTTDLVIDSLGLTRRPVDKDVATKQKTFESETIERAVFATGWDGTVVLTATSEGDFSVETER